MILDTDNLTEDAVLQADLCIVGAGAAGISLALQFLGTSRSVLLLESGGEQEEADTQALYAGTVSDERLHSAPDRYRQRRFGGTTTIWGGRCMPFDDIDFEFRPWLPHSGWPFGREALLPFYPAANRLCEAGEFSYDAAGALGEGSRPIIAGFRSAHFHDDALERFSCPTDFAARYAHKLRSAGNIRVLLHANVTHIRLARSGAHVESLEVATLAGRRRMVHAREFVLAAGGLETARLLLANRDVHPNGIGNDRDLVGRFYMCHMAGTIGTVRLKVPPSSVHHGYDLSPEGVYCRRRFALCAQTQRSLKIGNFIARLHHPRIPNPAHGSGVLSLLYLAKPVIPYEYAKRLYGEDAKGMALWLRHAGNVLTDPLAAVRFAWQMLRHRKLAARKFPSIIVKPRTNVFELDFHAEQQPNPASRVRLSEERDALGMPRLHVDWQYLPMDLETVQQSLRLFAGDLAQLGLGSFDYDPATVEGEMTRYGAYGGHHIGTARMGTDPATSVVDADCRVHGLDNLYVAGSAVFPTSGQANPTLTIVALTLRLAEHLKSVLLRQDSPACVTVAQELFA